VHVAADVVGVGAVDQDPAVAEAQREFREAVESTSWRSSSCESRLSVKLVLSPNSRKTRFELPVSTQTSGLAAHATARSPGATSRP
jgi:hypothetical protein